VRAQAACQVYTGVLITVACSALLVYMTYSGLICAMMGMEAMTVHPIVQVRAAQSPALA
jgi:hypothetical protein